MHGRRGGEDSTVKNILLFDDEDGDGDEDEQTI